MKATPTEAEILRHVESMVDATAEDEKLKIMNLFHPTWKLYNLLINPFERIIPSTLWDA